MKGRVRKGDRVGFGVVVEGGVSTLFNSNTSAGMRGKDLFSNKFMIMAFTFKMFPLDKDFV